MRTLDLACHEFHANALFNSHGLAPFFACDSQVKAGDGSVGGSFDVDGELWTCKLSYQESNIVHPGEQTPQGTEFRIQQIREFRLKVARQITQDPIGKQSFTAHVSPRWPGMLGQKGDGTRVKIPVPEGFGEGVNVRLKGSNVEFGRYLTLLKLAMNEVGIAGRYFEKYHESSNIQDAERYVRVHKDKSGPIHARDGAIAAMGHLLEHDRKGYRKLVQNDDDNHGRNLPGFYHTATLDARRIRQAFPSHSYPKEVKHYYAKEVLSLSDDHPLAHPKVGSSLQSSLLERDQTVYLDDLDELVTELDQTVLSVLADGGLDVAPSGLGPFFEDAYFKVQVDEDGPNPVALNMVRIRHRQESVVIKHLADGLSPVQWGTLSTLVKDGGELSPQDVADREGYHVESVRRALRDMEDLVHREYAKVSLRSEYIADLVHEAVEEARSASQKLAETAGKALEAAERGLDETMSAFIAWAARHGVDVDDARSAKMLLRFGGMETARDAERAIREGFTVWRRAGMPEERYRMAEVRFPGGAYSTAWRYLYTG
ncbi:MarR family transcriptional regulator [Haloarculaceae archaeon H-GB11]|nr:MarR family transcriptional regulator [Haloarculaceae archaeon H-GB11]